MTLKKQIENKLKNEFKYLPRLNDSANDIENYMYKYDIFFEYLDDLVDAIIKLKNLEIITEKQTHNLYLLINSYRIMADNQKGKCKK